MSKEQHGVADLLRRFLPVVVVVPLLCAPGVARAETATIAWSANADQENVAGYIVSYGSASRAVVGFRGYEVNVDVGLVTQHTIEFPLQRPHYLAIRAYNDLGVVSDFSEEIVLGGANDGQNAAGSPERGAKPGSSSASETLGSTGSGNSPNGGQLVRANARSSAKQPTREELGKIAELERQRDRLLLTYTPKHPDVRALQWQLDELRREVGLSP